MDKVLLEKVNELLILGIGDVGRLSHIKNMLEQDLQLYASDAKYLDNLIKTHLPDAPKNNLENDVRKEIPSENLTPQNINTENKPDSSIPDHIRITSTRNYVRPLGVTIIAILEIIGGLSSIGMGLSWGVLVGFVAAGAFDMVGNTIMGIFSGAMVAMGIVPLVLAWGLLKGKSWAWTVTLIFTIIHLIFSIPSINLIALAINIVVLYYLYRPHVKAYFGK